MPEKGVVSPDIKISVGFIKKLPSKLMAIFGKFNCDYKYGRLFAEKELKYLLYQKLVLLFLSCQNKPTSNLRF